ncbi:DedA family protein [Saccharomonospora sp. NPDC046836]|uniref:DedA family protein n=1 Tax=Saccharomonospora sp. NPDC046836 TaxID=3156921 RepID=UPI00340ACE9A
MAELLHNFTAVLADLLDSPWLWLVVLAVAGLDALLPFMPSESTVMVVAVLLGGDLAGLTLLTVVAATGALAGDLLGYWLARRAGPRTLRRLQRNEKGRRHYEWAKDRLDRHATLLIVAGRYVPGGRVASALATGSLRYPAGRFAVLDAIGTTVWAVYAVAIGHLGATQFAGEPVKGMLLAFAVGLLAVACVELGRRLLSRRGLREVRRGDRNPQRRSASGRGGGRTEHNGALMSQVDSPAAGPAHCPGTFLGDRGSGRPDR